MNDAPAAWRISVEVACAAAAPLEAALESLGGTVATFESGDASCCVEAYVAECPEPGTLAAALALAAAVGGVPVPGANIETVPARDWVAASHASFPPTDVGPFHLYGSHDRGPLPAGRIGILMDAGIAFGSGRHASTIGTMLALAELRHVRIERPLDLGCGSGILAIASALLWRRPVLASDIDPVAVAATRDNARRNGVGPLVRAIRADGYRSAPIRAAAPFDLITANILARPLAAMAGDLATHLASGGIAVLSGFLEADAGRVVAAHRARGLDVRRRLVIDGWQTLVVGRRAAPSEA